MITALATVSAVKEVPNGYSVELSCEQTTSCSHCSSQKSCGTGIVSKAIGNKSHSWHIETEKKLSVGHVVEIGLPERNLIQFASLVYILPLAALLIGALLGQFIFAPILGGGEGWTILSSCLFMLGGVWLARYYSTKLESGTEQVVTMLRVLGDEIDIAQKIS